MTEYFDPAQLAALAENLDPSAVAETADFKRGGGDFFIQPGEYVNPSRSIHEVRQEPDGTVTIVLTLTGGIVLPSGKVTMDRFPERKYLSNRLRQSQFGTGMTSEIADYYKAVGFETAGRGIADLLTSLPETLDIPAPVFVTLTDKPKPNGDGTYTKSTLKLKDFRSPEWTKDNPTYLRSVERDGVTLVAKPKISRFVPRTESKLEF